MEYVLHSVLHFVNKRLKVNRVWEIKNYLKNFKLYQTKKDILYDYRNVK